MSIILSEAGYTAITASSGEEALEKAESERPGLLILDLIMPGMSGCELLKKLKEIPTLRQMPIVICTAKELSLEAREKLTGSVRSIVQKGENIREKLLEAVKEIESWQTRKT